MKMGSHRISTIVLLLAVGPRCIDAFLVPFVERVRPERPVKPVEAILVGATTKFSSFRLGLSSSDGSPLSHGYERDPIDDTRVDEDAVHQLLKLRTVARQQQAFAEADTLRDRLLYDHGVRVSDSSRIWRTGCNPESGSGMNKKWGRAPADANGLSSPIGKPSESIRGKDRFQEDQTGRSDGSRSRLPPYREGDTPRFVTNEDPGRAATIQALVDQRDAARWERNYALADSIQLDLLEIHGIEINDRKRLWRERRSTAPTTNFSGATKPPPPPARRTTVPRSLPHLRGSTGSLTDDEVIQVEKLIAERAAAQEQKDFSRADHVRETLRNEFLVGIDDRSGEWMVAGGDYDRSPMVIGNYDEELLTYIQQQVQLRSVAKLTKDYATADRIRDDLLEKYQVAIDDRLKSWSFHKMPAINTELTGFDASKDPTLESEAPGVPSITEVSVESDGDDDDDDSLVYSDSDVEVERAEKDTSEDLSKLKVPELKERLRAARLPVSGLKAELIERLSQSC